MINTPFEHEYFIGYVNQVLPQYIMVHFPASVLLKNFVFKGEHLNGGLVGSFVVIEGHNYGFLGKILELSLSEKERLQLSEQSFQNKEFHPSGKIEILLSFDLFEPEKVQKGLNSLPTIGAKVFVCTSAFLKSYFKGFGVKPENKETAPTINIGSLTYDTSAKIEISQQALFGRHCAVVGTTGGGKSYTTSKLFEGIISNKGKAILIDATGEYNSHDNKTYSSQSLILSTNSYFPYSRLTIGDLFVLFRPGGQVQQPILLEAIKSLKLAHCLVRDLNQRIVYNGNVGTLNVHGKNLVIEDGCIRKQGCETEPFKRCYLRYANEIEDSSKSDFNIQKLNKQILFECYYDNGNIWSANRDERTFSNCTSLLMRINSLINDDGFKNILGFQVQEGSKDIVTQIEDFLENNDTSLLRIGFENVPFSFQSREILANAIGKLLLNQSRTGKFKKKPIVLFLDEAHQFLNKNVRDEYFESTELNSFDSIAKECRKYGLFLCISTQMPRDIPVGTLSQIGTFIVHRLINHFDKESIASACSTANRNSLEFLPTLGAGEAILMGVDFPMPVMLKVNSPNVLPDSNTPQFTK
ncbi:ATP-binding protein [Flavobacterium sp.]|uniref:ATP-binding protein n=1 Tax=Flavobacterium sp. TaxID=239 RepID=UPI002633509E|nr:ATP-binding protein [Flavobacterium sp.]